MQRRFLRGAGTDVFCVDTGYAPDRITTPRDIAEAAGGTAYEVVRLEGVAESVQAAGIEPDAYAAPSARPRWTPCGGPRWWP